MARLAPLTLYTVLCGAFLLLACKLSSHVSAQEIQANNGALLLETRSDVHIVAVDDAGLEARRVSVFEDIVAALSDVPTQAELDQTVETVEGLSNVVSALQGSVSDVGQQITEHASDIDELSRAILPLDGVSTSLASVISDLANVKPQQASLVTTASSLETDVSDLEGLTDSISTALSEQTASLAQTNGQLTTLTSSLSQLSDQVDGMDALQRGDTASRPAGASCASVLPRSSSTFHLNPYGGVPGVFKAFCDFDIDDKHGWAKVLQYPGRNIAGWKPGSTGDVGTDLGSNPPNAFSKLADAKINSIRGPSGHRIFMFTSTCTNDRLFVLTKARYDDRLLMMGLAEDPEDSAHCVATSLEKCNKDWMTSDMRRISNRVVTAVDVLQHRDDQGCSRWFFGHVDSSGNGYVCYNPEKTDQRCFSAGMNCNCNGNGNHPIHENGAVYVRPLEEAGRGVVPGLVSSLPAQSCQEILDAGLDISQTYWLQPGGLVEPFKGYCDQETLDGGWLKIVHGPGIDYPQQWTPSVAKQSVGSVHLQSPGSFAKLSDDQINAYAAPWLGGSIYRLSSACTAATLIIDTLLPFDDTAQGTNIAFGGARGCLAGSSMCNPNNPNVVSPPYLDNASMSGNNCNRYFSGHLGGSNWQCYSVNRRSSSSRCFSAGSTCTCNQGVDHPVHRDFVMYVKRKRDL